MSKNPAGAAAITEKLKKRRAALKASGHVHEGHEIPEGGLGLAFSGGGIRSATISLGVAQALARHKRLLDFDYLSTVSGGGYIGSFLASLFLPDAARGSAGENPPPPSDTELRQKREFAHEVLTAPASEHEGDFTGVKENIRQPVWWLREHSRYLAPNGATDFAGAAFYMIRNWLAMLYVFSLPILLVFLLSTAGVWAVLTDSDIVGKELLKTLLGLIHFGGGAVPANACHCTPATTDPAYVISPILLLVPVALFVTLAAGLAYWLTENLKLGLIWREGGSRRPDYPPQISVFVLVGLTLAGGIGAYLALGWVKPDGNMLVQWLVRLGEAITIAGGSLAALMVAWTTFAAHRESEASDDYSDAFTIALRSNLTTFGTWWMLVTLVLLAFGIVDTLALLVHDRLWQWIEAGTLLPSLSAALVPIGAWAINKISSATSDSSGRFTKILATYAPVISLVAGVVLFGMLAVIGDVVIQSAIWNSQISWPQSPVPADAMDYDAVREIAAAGIILLIVTGLATGFINLSSLHSLYASRLTRAYLGATNIARLRAKKGITDSDGADYIDVSRYQQHASAGPLHLINVTLNETQNRQASSIVDRDRKGVPMVFGPEGLFVDPAHGDSEKTKRQDAQPSFFDWDTLREQHVESLSVGQLCAISGAAASPGMGARTSLGTSLALTFANIRLGYWWDVRDLLRGKRSLQTRLGLLATRLLRTYFYLVNEMLGRYSRDYRRVYLSDGGHFENSAAYELLRRGTKAILVCDNGADPQYQFEDLQNLVRKARIDLGLELRVAAKQAVADLFGPDASPMFLNAVNGDWRKAASKQQSSAFVLLIEVFANGEDKPCGRILWLKPCLMPDMPEDLIGYAVANPDFPQQTTANQFFDEAQWESYRMLGCVMTEKLLSGSGFGGDLVRRAMPAG